MARLERARNSYVPPPPPPPLPPFCQICNLAAPAASTEKDAENECSPDAPDFIHLNTYARRARTATKTRLETYLIVLFLSADFLSCCSIFSNIQRSREECKSNLFEFHCRSAAVSNSVFSMGKTPWKNLKSIPVRQRHSS